MEIVKPKQLKEQLGNELFIQQIFIEQLDDRFQYLLSFYYGRYLVATP
jgi:hypothetical protein